MKVFTAAAFFAATSLSSAATAESYSSAKLERSGSIISAVHGDETPGALYESGSIGKFACTLAALRLVDRGVFNLDQTLGTLLPEAEGSSISDVTLRQVLASRSGVADGLLPAFGTDPATVMATPDARTAVRRYTLGEPAAKPGTAWSYDLVNWVIVQAVIEHATGRSIADVLSDLVIIPSGMGSSRVFVGEIGEGAQPPAAPGRPLPEFLTCAGGLATTAGDLLALARFPHKGGLSATSLEALTTVMTDEEDYTLGGRFISKGQRMVSWQTGSNGAYKSLVVYDPLTDTGFAAMTASNSNEEIQKMRSEWMKQSGIR